MNASELTAARTHVFVLLGAWIGGTVLVLAASSIAPLAGPSSAVEKLRQGWAWYAGGYALFFVADGAIALLGASLGAWLRIEGSFRGPAIGILFALSGLLGMLADIAMLGAAGLFRGDSPLLSTSLAPAFLDALNTACNFLSAASFLPAALAAWLLCVSAHARGVDVLWIGLTKFGAVYQLALGLASFAAFLFQQDFLLNLSLAGAIFGLPLFTIIWLVWALKEMHRQLPTLKTP